MAYIKLPFFCHTGIKLTFWRSWIVCFLRHGSCIENAKYKTREPYRKIIFFTIFLCSCIESSTWKSVSNTLNSKNSPFTITEEKNDIFVNNRKFHFSGAIIYEKKHVQLARKKKVFFFSKQTNGCTVHRLKAQFNSEWKIFSYCKGG